MQGQNNFGTGPLLLLAKTADKHCAAWLKGKIRKYMGHIVFCINEGALPSPLPTMIGGPLTQEPVDNHR